MLGNKPQHSSYGKTTVGFLLTALIFGMAAQTLYVANKISAY